jgi:hypothetical protein
MAFVRFVDRKAGLIFRDMPSFVWQMEVMWAADSLALHKQP